jgi:hypothetical protein
MVVVTKSDVHERIFTHTCDSMQMCVYTQKCVHMKCIHMQYARCTFVNKRVCVERTCDPWARSSGA